MCIIVADGFAALGSTVHTLLLAEQQAVYIHQIKACYTAAPDQHETQ